MPKQKLRKFGELKQMSFVLEYPYPKLVESGFPYKGSWAQQFFGGKKNITLELGCGGGEYTVALAERDSHTAYIGVDRKGARIWSGAKDVIQKGLTNVAFLRTDINLITSFFGTEEVDNLWITFPDPMMKKTRRRLLSSFYLEKYAQFLTPGGKIHLKTDSPFLYQYTLDLLRANAIDPICATEDLYGSTEELQKMAIPEVKTRYEKQWLARHMAIKFVVFSLPSGRRSFQEPENEPPIDNYRSLCVGSQKFQEIVNQ